MKKVFIVGNGPLSGRIGRFVDNCDFVIRMNGYRTKGFEDLVGKKIDAYGLYPGREKRNIRDSDFLKDWNTLREIWFCRPIFWCFSIDTFKKYYKIFRRKKIVKFMDHKAWENINKSTEQCDLLTRERDEINRWVMDPQCKDQIGPSTGFSVIQMSIRRFSEDNIYISGFSSDPSLGWYWGVNQKQSLRHPWMWERSTISELLDSGRLMLPK